MYLLVKGRIDIDAEIKKGKEKLAAAQEGMEKKRKIVGGEGWEKMREYAQEVERKHLANAEQEVKVLEGSVEQFEKLRLE